MALPRFARPAEGRVIAGVCAGIGQFFGIDANIVRIIFAILTVFSAGAAALVLQPAQLVHALGEGLEIAHLLSVALADVDVGNGDLKQHDG